MITKDGTKCMVYFSPEMAEKLDRAKQKEFYNESKSEMLRVLILRGLEAGGRTRDSETDPQAS